MTTNQTIDGVPRELLKQALRIAEAVHFPTDNYETKLRALLDGPVRTPLLGGGALEEQPEWAQIQILKNTVADLQGDIEKLQAELALQPQDEPVAWRFRWDYDHGNGWCRNAVRFVESMEHVEHEDKSTWRDVTPLYAEQPAPVAVKDYQNKINHLKQLLRNVRATLHFSPEDVLAIDAALRENDE